MNVSVRYCVHVGVATVTAAAVALAPSVDVSMPATAGALPAPAQQAPPIDLAASTRSLVTAPPNPERFAAATAAMGRLDPASVTAVVPAAAAVPLNAASDFVVSSYQFIRYWVTYGVQVADYVLGFIPFGYAIADQVNIFYYTLILPISDSIVYNLVVPVVNDPLNLASYVNGLIAVGQTSINAAINTGIAEFNYFFGWLIPPLPPLPLAAAARALPAEEEVTTLAADLDPGLVAAPEAKDAPEDSLVTRRLTATTISEPTAEPTDTPEATEAPEPTDTPEPTEGPKPPTTTSVDGVQAQGEVRGGTQVTTTTSTTTTTTTATTADATAGTTANVKPPATSIEAGPATAPQGNDRTGDQTGDQTGPADTDTDGNATQD